jgi:hypothetical protein
MSRAFAENWEVKMKEKMATPKHPKMIECVPIGRPQTPCQFLPEMLCISKPFRLSNYQPK